VLSVKVIVICVVSTSSEGERLPSKSVTLHHCWIYG
jgi:hypothetical protein